AAEAIQTLNMVILDTDHMTIYERSNSLEYQRLKVRLDRFPSDEKTTTIITYEEQTRGWLAYAAKARSVVQQVEAYRNLRNHLRVFCEIGVLYFGETAATIFNASNNHVSTSAPWTLKS